MEEVGDQQHQVSSCTRATHTGGLGRRALPAAGVHKRSPTHVRFEFLSVSTYSFRKKPTTTT
jgi:hypothetical protein